MKRRILFSSHKEKFQAIRQIVMRIVKRIVVLAVRMIQTATLEKNLKRARKGQKLMQLLGETPRTI